MEDKRFNFFKESDYLGKMIKSKMKMVEGIGFYEVMKFDTYISCKLVFTLYEEKMKKINSSGSLLFNTDDFFNQSEFMDCTPDEFENKYPEYFI
jgi:hypothetical protein